MAKGHASFERKFIWAAHFLALVGGFNLGAHLAWYIGMRRPLPMDFPVWIQAHGHLQLLGWTGLYIMGVSLYFMPRLLAVPLRSGRIQQWILGLIFAGLILEVPARFIWFHVTTGWLRIVTVFALIAGGLLTLSGGCLYIFSLTRLFFDRRGQRTSGVRQMRPFMFTMFTGWFTYLFFHFYFTFQMIHQGQPVMGIEKAQWLVHVFLYLVLIPVTLAFSFRTFPLYLETPPAPPKVSSIGIVYGAVTALTLLLTFPGLEGSFSDSFQYAVIGRMARAGLILILVGCLQLWRKWPSPAAIAQPDKRAEARQLYRTMHDFGRSEILLYAAYGWLIVAAGFDFIRWGSMLWNGSLVFPRDPIRHLYLLGFVTTLIFGMAQRMLPGFMGRRRLAYPGWVLIMGIFIALATLFRVVPLMLPTDFAYVHPGMTRILLIVFGQSGWLMMIAVGMLWRNLYATNQGRGRAGTT